MTAERRPHLYKYVAIGLVACSMLMHEILLTRVCALRLYFNFAFLVISNCLLGLGASGAILAVFKERWKDDSRTWLGRFCAAYLVTLIGTYFFLIRFPLPEVNLSNSSHLFSLSVFNLVGAVPFLFGGLVIGMILTYDTARVNELYAVDLVGAGIGCFACPALLPFVGGGGVFVASALLALGATVVVLYERMKMVAVAGGVLLGALGLSQLTKLDDRFPVPSKGFFDYARALATLEGLGAPYSVWTANSRIDSIRNKKGPKAGIFMRGTKEVPVEGGEPVSAGIAQDAMAGTCIVNFSGEPQGLEIIRHTMYSAAYRMKFKPKVLIIGLGGGNDAWAAKVNDASSIKAIELNWPIVDIHKRILKDYSRDLVNDPNVQLIVGEGRSALMREQTRYDVIQMTGIDTWTALASGAYVLAENYLYTTEAIASMYKRLEPDGIIQISRFSETMEALRLFSNIDAALRSVGVKTIERSVVALATRDKMMAVQIKKGDYTLDEQWKIFHFAEDNGIEVLYLPNRPTDTMVQNFIRSKDKQSIIDAFPMNITPTSDDQPYFFSYTKWNHPIDSIERMGDVPSVSQGNPFFILSQLILSMILSAAFILLPVARLAKVPKAGTGKFLAYFSGLGMGFIFIEISVIQKLTLFLGQPVYSLTVTLFSLLVFTGLGSLTFGNRFEPGDRRVMLVPAAIALYLAIFTLGSPSFVNHFIALPVGARIAITVIGLAPLGFLLGIPFAHGMKVLGRSHPELTPWAWAINGSMSVVGSIATVVLSMNFGFAAVLWTATLVYTGAFYALVYGGGKKPEGAIAAAPAPAA